MIAIISIKREGNYRKAERYFKKLGNGDVFKGLQAFGEEGVKALADATPKDTGKTASSWSYSIDNTNQGISISWSNSNRKDGASIAILIQYGHATPSGYYVEGVDYINPALKPIFEKIGKKVWWEVTKNAYYY